jgi:quinoprotein dehydrogenase-associated probable ABC transporter substrate-binding protein
LIATNALAAPPASHPAPLVLHIVADPNNLPFSNDREEGFENKIAQLIASDLHATIEYTWYAQRRGFFRETIKHGSSDVVMGVPADLDRVLRTKPYFRSSYVFVYRTDAAAKPASFDDPQLSTMKIGVPLVGGGNNSPPAQALAERGIIDSIVGYTVYGDYREENPTSQIIRDVVDRKIDVAIVWGPLGGYFTKLAHGALQVIPVSTPATLSTPFAFDICVGVKRSRPQLRDQIDMALARHRAEIDRILEGYGVPRLNDAAVVKDAGNVAKRNE